LPKNNTSIFDTILSHKDSNQHIVANTYLHILNAHPKFLEQYTLDQKTKLWFSIRSKLALLIKIMKSIIDSKHFYTQKKENKIDVLFISHLINAKQLLQDNDSYFGEISNQLLESDISSGLVLMNHIGMNGQKIPNNFLNKKIQRFVLSPTLDFLSEIKLYLSQRRSLRLLKTILNNLHISKFIKKDISRHHLSSSTFSALRVAKQVAGIIDKTGAKFIITTYEGYAWERLVYYYARKANPKIKCFGFQHAAVFEHQHAIKRSLKVKYNPDVVLTSGSISHELLTQAKFQDTKLIQLGSPRHLDSTLILERPECCLVLPDAFISECFILFEFSLLYAKKFKNQKFIWRLHPMLSFEKLKKNSNIFDNLPSNIFLSTQNLEFDIDNCDSVLYRGSTAVIDAINSGLTPIYYQMLSEEKSIDPIFQCKNGKYVVSNENELNYVLLAKGTNQKKQLLHDFAQDFYTPINIAPLLDEFNNFF